MPESGTICALNTCISVKRRVSWSWAHGRGCGEGCSVNVYRIKGQHILARVDSRPHLPVRVGPPFWGHGTHKQESLWNKLS